MCGHWSLALADKRRDEQETRKAPVSSPPGVCKLTSLVCLQTHLPWRKTSGPILGRMFELLPTSREGKLVTSLPSLYKFSILINGWGLGGGWVLSVRKVITSAIFYFILKSVLAIAPAFRS